MGETANKIILLKTLYPRADLTQIVQRNPSVLLLSNEELQDNARQVCGGDGCKWGGAWLCWLYTIVTVAQRVASLLPLTCCNCLVLFLVLHASCCCWCYYTVQVKQLLVDAKDPDVLLTALPSLLEPRTLISVLVTVRKW